MQLCSETYYQLTEIHPYFNGNGRLTTLLIEIILLSFSRPSIVLRTAKDKKDPNSLYSKTFKNVDVNQKLLTQHISIRMNEPYYSNVILANRITCQIQLIRYFILIQQYHPKFNLNAYYLKTSQELNSAASVKFQFSDNWEEIKLHTQIKMLQVYKELYENLEQQSKYPLPKPPSETTGINQDNKAVLEKLKKLTGCTEGKIIILGEKKPICLLSLNDLSKSEKLTESLNATKFLKSEITKTQTGKSILKIEILDVTKLKELQSLPTYENQSTDCNDNNAGFSV